MTVAATTPSSLLERYRPFVLGVTGMTFSRYPLESLVVAGGYELLCRTKVLDTLAAGGGTSAELVERIKKFIAPILGASFAVLYHVTAYREPNDILDTCPIDADPAKVAILTKVARFVSGYFPYIVSAVGAIIAKQVPKVRNVQFATRAATAIGAYSATLRMLQGALTIPALFERISEYGMIAFNWATVDWFRGAVCLGAAAYVLTSEVVKSRLQFLTYIYNHGLQFPDKPQVKRLAQIADLEEKRKEAEKKTHDLNQLQQRVEAATVSGAPLPKETQAKVDKVLKPEPKDRKEWIDQLVKTAQGNLDNEKKGSYIPGTQVRTGPNYNAEQAKQRIKDWLPKELTDAERADVMNRLKF